MQGRQQQPMATCQRGLQQRPLHLAARPNLRTCRPAWHNAQRCRAVQLDDFTAPGPSGRSTATPPAAAPPAPGSKAAKSPEGYLALLGVAVLWGSYTPAIRLLYDMPTPPDPPLLNALQAVLSALFLVAANVTASLSQRAPGAPSPKPFASNPLMQEDIAIRQAIIRKDRAGRRRQHDAHDPALPQDDEAGPLEWRGEQPSTAPLQQQQQQQQPRPRLPASPTSPASSLSAPPPAAFKAAGSSSSSSRAAGVAGGGGSSGGRKLTPLSAEVARVASPAASGRRPAGNALEHAVAEALNWRSDSLQLAGGEVGLWMCLAFSLEVAGLQLASATKVAFLNQVSVLVTPLLVHLSGERVRGLEWAACGLGLLGSILVALDSLMGGGGGGGHGHGGAVDGASNEVLGLAFVLASALFFALSTVRLGRYSSQFDPLQLSTASTSTLGLLSLVWVAASILGRENGGAYELEVINTMLASTTCLLTLVWVGLGPGALAAFLQATGQKSVPPAQAQVLYSTTPLWAAGFAFLALDTADETMGGIAWAGAAVMLASSLMAALLPPDEGPGDSAGGGDAAAAAAGGSDGAGAMAAVRLPLSTFEESDTEPESDSSGSDGGRRGVAVGAAADEEGLRVRADQPRVD